MIDKSTAKLLAGVAGALSKEEPSPLEDAREALYLAQLAYSLGAADIAHELKNRARVAVGLAQKETDTPPDPRGFGAEFVQ